MASTPQRGPGIGLPLAPMQGNNGVRSLPAGSFHPVPAGQWYITPGPYTFVEFLDPVSGLWRAQSPLIGGPHSITSDGQNYRVANRTGTALGAYVTNVGSAYTSAPVVTASAGGSAWTAIVGGAINATVTITTAGAGYNYAPTLIIDAPPSGGVQATAICALSAGAINSVTVINQGAGYTTVPKITIVPSPYEALAATPGPTTAGALTVNATLAGANTITAVVCTNPGTPLTSVPTLTFTGGGGSSAAATVAMVFTCTGFTVGTAGTTYGNAQPFGVLTFGGGVSGSAGAVINPDIGANWFVPRQANILGTSTAGGAVTATGAVINDGGLFMTVPTALVIGQGVTAIITATVGGTNDTYHLTPV